MTFLKTLLVFIIAGVFEIGGGYMVWKWLKAGNSAWIGLSGFLALAIFGWVMTMQDAPFARVYAAYGGIFIVMSLLWAYVADDFVPDKYDIIGSILVLCGVGFIYFMPRQ